MNTHSVALRKKKIAKGEKISLYLDFYPPIETEEGKTTRREFLGLYLYANPKTKEEKQYNKTTEAEANVKLLKRAKEVNLPKKVKPKPSVKLRDYAQQIVDSHEVETTKRSWQTAVHYLQDFLVAEGIENITFDALTIQHCKDYRQYLATTGGNKGETLSKNSRALYLIKFKTVLRTAHENELVAIDLARFVKSLPTTQSKREYLTIDELRTLSQVPCVSDKLKRASLFSALTGLRFSDVAKMLWGEIRQTSEGAELHYTQKKTNEVQVLPIGKQALELLGEREADQQKVFKDLTRTVHTGTHIARWVADAGITKRITFHCFRHTFATIQLEAGTDIYTLSKLLGHRDISTTQLYANIVDKTKRDAMNKITL